MKYGSSDTYTTLAFVIINNGQEHILNEARIEKAGTNYSCLNGSLRIGTTLEDALIALGAPNELEISDNQPKPQIYDYDVLYTNMNGTNGYHYYANTAHGIRVFFWENKATAIYIFQGSEKITRD